MKRGKSTWRIQSNGSKDDLRPWKNNGGIDGEDQEIFSKDLENLNNRVDTTITEMKNTPEEQQNKWGWRTDKWSGRQDGGNHCHGTEWRKEIRTV